MIQTPEPVAKEKNGQDVAGKVATEIPIDSSNAQLLSAIKDAELLISYNSVHNAQLDSGAVKDVLAIKGEIESGSVKIETATAFWLALNALSNAATPATPASIKLASADDIDGKRANRPVFDGVYRSYRIITFCFLILAILLNGYWIVAKQTGEKLTEAYDRLQVVVSDLEKANALVAAAGELPPPANPTAEEKINLEALQKAKSSIPELEAKLANLSSSISGHFTVLQYLTLFFITSEDSDTSGRLAEIVLGYFRDIIGLTLAPLAFGGLGACVYVVRRIGDLVAAKAFDPDSRFSFRLRIYLGCIAGLAAAQFKIFGDTTSLTPLALAFIAGYAIEVFFSALDRLVGAFSGGSQKSTPNAGAR